MVGWYAKYQRVGGLGTLIDITNLLIEISVIGVVLHQKTSVKLMLTILTATIPIMHWKTYRLYALIVIDLKHSA